MSKIQLFAFVISSALVAIVSGQSAPRQPLPAAPLEKYGDAPMYIWRTESSPRMISQQGAFTSYQVNVGANGQNMVGDAANEPSITIDPTDPNKMAIGWRQFNSVASNFRQGGWAYTVNGGTSWTFPGVLQNNVFRSDPVLASNETGTFYYLSLIANFRDDIWRSLNRGQTWAQLGPATGGDKQWFTIDRTSSSGHGFQYQSWSLNASDYGDRQFTRSIDGGFTWMDPITIPNGPSFGTLDVDTNGNLFLGGVSPITGRLWCVRSSDARNAAIIPTFDQATEVNLDGQVVIGSEINPEGLVGQVFLAVDRSGTSTNDNVYMLASVQRLGNATGSDVMFSRSTDGGKTFSIPRRINDDPLNPNKWHWFGTLSVAPNGRIDVVWLDSRNAANNRDSQLFYSYSPDGGVSWSANVVISNSFDPSLGYPNQAKMGDYITIVSDASAGNVAYCATFNGEEDIYSVRIVPPAFVPAPTPSPTPTSTPKPTPTATSTPTGSPAPSPTATATPTPTASSPAQTINLSTRMQVASGDNVGIGGFIITGSAPKRVLLRALGPSLKAFGLTNYLANPVLELHGGPLGTVVNDNWKDDPAQKSQIESAGLAPTDDLESAIDATLNPGSYTGVVRDKTNSSGIAVIEVYDLSTAAPAKLANISTRAVTSSGNNIVIAGFTLGNQQGDDRMAVRGIGPSLANAGVTNFLPNPTLEVHSADGTLVAANDDWKQDPAQAAALSSAGLGLTNDLESGIVKKLPPGAYTALLIGANNSSGIGLIEIYDLGP